MRKLTSCIALLLVLSLSVTGAALAQNTMPVFCGDLSEADCEIITNAQTASATLDSGLYDFAFNLNVSGIPDAPSPLSFALTGSGSFSGVAAMQTMGMDPAAMQEMMMSDPGQYFEDALGGFDGDLNLTLTLPPELVEEMGGAGIPSSITLQIRLVDGFGYLNLDTLTPIIGEDALPMSGWVGMDLVSLIQGVFEQMPADFDMSMGMPTSGMEAFYDPEFLGSYMSIERTDDGTGDTAVFAFDLDFAAMFSSEAFQNLMREQMAAQMESMDTTLSDEEMDEALAMTSQMFQDVTFTMTEEIGLEDGFIHSISGAMNFDMASMMASMGESSEPAPVIDMTFSVNYSSFNSAPEITAPEDATIIPYEAVLNSAMGGMSASSEMGSVASSDDSEEATGEPPMAAEMTPTPTPAS